MARQIIKVGQVSENRKARFNYSIEDTIEAGIALTGAEIKSIRYGLVTIVDGFVQDVVIICSWRVLKSKNCQRRRVS